MGENEENHDDTTSLSQLFDKSLLLHNEILESEEETCSPEYQDRVKKGILMLEDATRLVSLLDIFSRNELFTEIETEYLKYFLLPVLLGKLSPHRGRLSTRSRRGEQVILCLIIIPQGI